MSTDPWHEVHQELALWKASGRKVRVWLRDDDAIRATPGLCRLEALALKHDFQIGLAVIPGLAEPEIVEHLRERRSVFHPMCHGWMHEMHGGVEVGEFGSSRTLPALRVDAVRALKRFQLLFGDHHPVFVPPFGRLNPTFLPELLRIGFAAVSNKPMLWQSRLARLHAVFSRLPQGAIWLSPAPGLLDVHVDPVDWARSTALSESRVVAQIVGELRLRRKGYIRTDAPIGILTHHLVHDEAVWTSLEHMFEVFCQSSAVEFQHAARLSMECAYAIHRHHTMADAPEFQWRDAIPYD